MESGREQLAAWITRRFGLNGEPTHGQQTDAAKLLKVDRSYLSQVLAGKRGVGLTTAVRFESLTGIPAEAWVPQPDGGASEPLSETAVSD